MSVTTYLGTSSQIRYWSLHVLVRGGFICILLSLTTLNSEEFTLCSGSFKSGGPSAFGIYMFIYALVFPYIFLLVYCLEWALIGHIEQERVHSVFW